MNATTGGGGGGGGEEDLDNHPPPTPSLTTTISGHGEGEEVEGVVMGGRTLLVWGLVTGATTALECQGFEPVRYVIGLAFQAPGKHHTKVT